MYLLPVVQLNHATCVFSFNYALSPMLKNDLGRIMCDLDCEQPMAFIPAAMQSHQGRRVVILINLAFNHVGRISY